MAPSATNAMMDKIIISLPCSTIQGSFTTSSKNVRMADNFSENSFIT
jgi:hypothetical protein